MRCATASASAAEVAVPFSGCFRPSCCSSSWKRWRSSARSIASGEVPRIGIFAASSAAASFSGVWPPSCTMTPEQRAVALLDAHQLDHVLGGQRLEIEPVGGVVIGRDGLGIAVDHDRLDAGLVEAVGGMDAAIVELDALADAVGAAAEDHHLVARSDGSASHSAGADPVALIGRIHVGRERRELGGAGVDALVDRDGRRAARAARRPSLSLRCRRARPSRASEKPMLLEPQQPGRVLRQAVGARPLPRPRRSRAICSRNHGSYLQAAWISSVVRPWR